jgi:hypothetical protein
LYASVSPILNGSGSATFGGMKATFSGETCAVAKLKPNSSEAAEASAFLNIAFIIRMM